MKAIRILILATLATPALAIAPSAMAASYAPGCTTMSRAQWISMEAAATVVKQSGYSIAKAKISGTCYEFYVRKGGAKTELFLDPTNAKLIHNTRGI